MIYIDFQPRGTSARRPALLGVLTAHGDGAHGDGAHDSARRAGAFTVYVLDPALAPAAAASRTSRVADLAAALGEILAQHKPIVSWSARDLHVVRQSRLPRRIARHFDSRWVNAVAAVRRWKNRLYADSALPSVASADGHALTVYMKAIGHDAPRALAPGPAADRLRDLLGRLEAADGDDGGLSLRAKRHWDALIDDTRRHCAGLRAVYMRACHDLALDAAYRQTTYCAEVAGRTFPIRIGRRHRALDTALRGAHAARWAAITAHNPQSAVLTPAQNARRATALERRLRADGIRGWPMTSVADDGQWPPEPGVLVLGVSRRLALALGREFDQAAVVWGRAGGRAELVWCNRLRPAVLRPSRRGRAVGGGQVVNW